MILPILAGRTPTEALQRRQTRAMRAPANRRQARRQQHQDYGTGAVRRNSGQERYQYQYPMVLIPVVISPKVFLVVSKTAVPDRVDKVLVPCLPSPSMLARNTVQAFHLRGPRKHQIHRHLTHNDIISTMLEATAPKQILLRQTVETGSMHPVPAIIAGILATRLRAPRTIRVITSSSGCQSRGGMIRRILHQMTLNQTRRQARIEITWPHMLNRILAKRRSIDPVRGIRVRLWSVVPAAMVAP